MSIRLLVADSLAVVRAGVAAIMSGTEIDVVGQAHTGAEVLELTQRLHPEVVLLDVRMPDQDGMTCLGQLREQSPNLPVVMFSCSANPTYVARSVALGASGYLTKSVDESELVSSIRQVAAGQSLWTRDELRRVKGSLASARIDSMLEVPLTKRENEVLKQLSLGLSNKEIAQALSISYETVKEHVQHVLRKLGVSDRTQAAVWAVRNGLA